MHTVMYFAARSHLSFVSFIRLSSFFFVLDAKVRFSF